jgi:hypothetical protein
MQKGSSLRGPFSLAKASREEARWQAWWRFLFPSEEAREEVVVTGPHPLFTVVRPIVDWHKPRALDQAKKFKNPPTPGGRSSKCVWRGSGDDSLYTEVRPRVCRSPIWMMTT